MKKKLRMIAGGVALITAFAGAAYMPSVSWIRGIGTGLLRQTLIFFREPVKDRDLMGELLGGQSYFQCVEENLSYEQICLENQRETEWDKQRFDVLEEQTVETSAAVKQEEVKKQRTPVIFCRIFILWILLLQLQKSSFRWKNYWGQI